MRRFLSVAVTLMVAMPAAAAAQPPRPPAVEVGVQVSRKIEDPGPRTWAPRVTLNLTHLTAIEGTGDIPKTFEPEFEGSARTTSSGYSAHWRQTLFTSGRWHVFGVLGAGVNRVERDFPERIFQGRDGPEVFPAYTDVDSEPVVHFGPAVQVELAPWLALRGDARLTIGDNNGGLRGMVGGVIPLGRFRAGDRPTGPPSPLAAWQRVKPGREVWVMTSNGRLVHGEVAAISDRHLNIRQRSGDVSITIDEVRLVEGRDSLKNGFFIGAASGAVAGGILFGWAASTFCEGDSCDGVEGVAVLLGAASGIAVGGLLGLMVDSAIPGKQTLFESGGIRFIPVVSANSKAIDITIGWR